MAAQTDAIDPIVDALRILDMLAGASGRDGERPGIAKFRPRCAPTAAEIFAAQRGR
jgi:hypothetical protein